MTSRTNNSTASGEERQMFSVLCLHDFQAEEPNSLSFRKNEILDVFKQEPTGWWAVVREQGSQVGWIPCAFVADLDDTSLVKLRNVRFDLRVYLYDVERLYNSSPCTPECELGPHHLSTAEAQGDVGASLNGGAKELVTPDLIPRRELAYLGEDGDSRSYVYLSGGDVDLAGARLRVPPPPSTPIPLPPTTTNSLLTEPTAPISFLKRVAERKPLRRHRPSASDTALPVDGEKTLRRSSEPMNDQDALSCFSTLTDSTAELTSSSSLSLSRTSGSGDSLRPFSDDEDALHFDSAGLGQLHLPWYLRPSYTSETLKVDAKGHVRAGTIYALVEKLTVDPINGMMQNIAFRNVFLMTFRSFVSPERLFELLVMRYQMVPPPNLTTEESEAWKEQKLRPTQQRVLTTIKIWVEDYNFMDEGSHLIRSLTDFLNSIITPTPLGLTAQHILQSLEKRASTKPPKESSPWKWGKTKAYKGDLIQLEPGTIAEHLCLHEQKLYGKIKLQECLKWASTQSGKSVANLVTFCGTHAKLTRWVKMTIMDSETTLKRAEIVDFWISVAERCHALNNFSSTSAIVAALSSATIAKLHMTWAAATRAAQLEPMLEYNNPSRAFASYRALLRSAEGPTVPFVPMFLTEITHIRDQIPDTLEPSNLAEPLVLFIKQQKWHRVISTMLQHQSRSYEFSSEKGSIAAFVADQLRVAEQKDEDWFWSKTAKTQATELGLTDIRASMAVAGFQ